MGTIPTASAVLQPMPAFATSLRRLDTLMGSLFLERMFRLLISVLSFGEQPVRLFRSAFRRMACEVMSENSSAHLAARRAL